MPGEDVGRLGAQKASYSPVVERITRGRGDLAIGAHLARRDGENDLPEGSIAIVMRSRGIAEQPSPGLQDRGLVKGNAALCRDWLTRSTGNAHGCARGAVDPILGAAGVCRRARYIFAYSVALSLGLAGAVGEVRCVIERTDCGSSPVCNSFPSGSGRRSAVTPYRLRRHAPL